VNIEWKIEKKRGNYRPLLHYTVTLGEFECGLCLPAVRVQSLIPRPPEASWSYCWPGQNERGQWTPSDWHLLMTPSHKDKSSSQTLKLPWREDNAYPEVEESFALLRDAFEEALTRAVQSAPMNLGGRLETSSVMRQTIAPAFAAGRILRAVGR
jgi:hypothetical protein